MPTLILNLRFPKEVSKHSYSRLRNTVLEVDKRLPYFIIDKVAKLLARVSLTLQGFIFPRELLEIISWSRYSFKDINLLITKRKELLHTPYDTHLAFH